MKLILALIIILGLAFISLGITNSKEPCKIITPVNDIIDEDELILEDWMLEPMNNMVEDMLVFEDWMGEPFSTKINDLTKTV